MSFSADDFKYMRRALQLAANGTGHVSPNPMVGAVIVYEDRIIGEGWHRHFGGPHAEVNAVRSVAEKDKKYIPKSTIYVTLEPCSHYGKTPPCAKMLCELGIGRVVVACLDPNPKVSGRGITMLRDAGIAVEVGLLEAEALALNKAFITAHSRHRPFVTLKWACSSDAFMDSDRASDGKPEIFSTTLTSQIVHSRRAIHDAIAVGATTAVMDKPTLTVRTLDGRNPRAVIFDRHGLVNKGNCELLEREDTIHLQGNGSLHEALDLLYSEYGITSLLVEGGASLLTSFLDSGLWDEAYVEVAPAKLGKSGRVQSPFVKLMPEATQLIGCNILLTYRNNR